MNVRTIMTYVLAVALIAPATGGIAAGQSGQGGPDAGPDQAGMTSASNAESARPGGDRVDAVDDRMLSPQGAVNTTAALARFGRCGTLTFSASGDTAMSSNLFADPFLSSETSFVCHTY